LGVLGGVRLLVPHAKSTETSRPIKVIFRYVPSTAEWPSFSRAGVGTGIPRRACTEGKIAVNEDSSTPIFSPYAGRVTKLLVKPSDMVERGQPLSSSSHRHGAG